MSFHLGARQPAFLLTLDRSSVGKIATIGTNPLFLLVWWVPFTALLPLSWGSLGEGSARKVAFGKELHDSELSVPLSLAILWALTSE